MPNKGKKCEVCKKTRACCGLPNGKATHCGKCKSEGMVNVKNKKCEVCKLKIPSYSLSGNKPTHCLACKTDEMLDNRNNKCKKCNNKQSCYAFEGKYPMYCVECKEDGMIDVRSKKCIICNKKQPVFKITTSKVATHCADCKEENMFDCKSKMCVDCNIKNPIFGLPNTRPTHCGDCKKDIMVDLKNPKCENCKIKQATYAKELGLRASHCRNCKPEKYVDVKHDWCKRDGCELRGNIKYKGYCTWCFQHLFPEDPLTKKIYGKTLETEVVSAVLERDNEYKHDKAMFIGGCDCSVRRRVDLWKVIGNTVLAIEVDENQHKNYDKDDEKIRYDDLFMAFSGKWIFIRFNPNDYKNAKNKLVKTKVKDRIPTLLQEIGKHEERIKKEQNLDLVEIHRLFYDTS